MVCVIMLPMIERLSRNNELRERFESWGIEMVLFDVDNTLINTSKLYREKMGDYCQFLEEKSGYGSEELAGMYFEAIYSMRDEFNVIPAIMEYPARILGMLTGVDGEELEKEIGKILEIYDTNPDVFDGAVEQVKRVRDAGVDTAVVTHAEEGWTFDKLKNFRGLFKEKICTPIDEPKDSRAWYEGMERLGVEPEEVMIVGDSISSDIIPGLQLGVGKLVWISSGKKWEDMPVGDVYLYPQKPDEVIVIESIDKLDEALLAV